MRQNKKMFSRTRTGMRNWIGGFHQRMRALGGLLAKWLKASWRALGRWWGRSLWWLVRISRVPGQGALVLPFPKGDWRRQVLEDFAEWLGEVEPPAARPEDFSHDLLEVVTELSALRKEVKLQSREQRRFSDTLGSFEGRQEEVERLLRGSEEALDALREGVKQDTEKSVFLLFADLRDTLQRGIEEIEQCSQKKRFSWRPPPGLEGFEGGFEAALARLQGYEAALDQFREAYEIALGRFDRVLSHLGIEKIPAKGYAFDARTMVAVGTRQCSEGEEGTVVEESISGYVRNDEILRPAQVVVATTPESGNSAMEE